MQSKKSSSIWSATFVIVVALSFLGSVMGNGVHNGVNLLVEMAGGSTTFSGIVTACFSFSALLARFVAGSLSDKRGRRFVITIGACILLAGCLVSTIISSFYFFILSRAMMGVGFSMVVTASIAAIADIVPTEHLGQALGYQGLAYAIAMALGPAVAVWLAGCGRVQLFGTFGVLALIAVVLSFCVKLPMPPAVKREAAAVKKKNNPVSGFLTKYIEVASLKPSFVIFLIYMPMTLYMAFMSVYAEQEHIGGVGVYFIVAAVVMIVVRLVFGKSFDRLKINQLLIPAILIGIVGILLPLIFGNEVALIASGACYGVYCGFTQPLLTTDALKRAPEERHGAASATYNIGCDVGVTIGSTVWGMVIANLGFQWTFVINIAILVVAAIFALVLLKDS